MPKGGVLRTACDATHYPAISGKGYQRATALHTPVSWSQMFMSDWKTALRTGRMRSVKPSLAQPNRMRNRTVQALHLSVGYSDFVRLVWRYTEVGLAA